MLPLQQNPEKDFNSHERKQLFFGVFRHENTLSRRKNLRQSRLPSR